MPVEQLPDPFAPPVLNLGPDGGLVAEPKRKRRWPVVLYALGGLLLIVILWLVITAPLSRAC